MRTSNSALILAALVLIHPLHAAERAQSRDSLAKRTRDSSAVVDKASRGGVAAQVRPTTDPDVAGVEVGRKLEPARAPARNADHEFLRTMADYNQGSIELTVVALDRGKQPATKQDAQRAHDAHIRMRKDLLQRIQSEYQEQLEPSLLDDHKQRMDSLHLAKTEAFDRTFYAIAADHDRAWIRRIDDLAPRLRSATARSVATQLRSDLQREIDEFTRQRLSKSPEL